MFERECVDAFVSASKGLFLLWQLFCGVTTLFPCFVVMLRSGKGAFLGFNFESGALCGV